ncbi:hypothetical protein JCM9279_005864 [Rhodotorula babjevae]
MDDPPPEPWQSTRAGKRILELNEVEENIAALLHFAGCSLAALHPDPLSSFTSRELATDDDGGEGEGEGGEGSSATADKRPRGDGSTADDAKLAEFAKYAEGYYATLNDIQLALRTSIRHLRVSRTSAAPLVDPLFARLVSGGGGGGASSAVGPGGVARGTALEGLEGGVPRWREGTERLPGRERRGEGRGRGRGREDDSERAGGRGLSVAALELERDAWAGLVMALEAGR